MRAKARIRCSADCNSASLPQVGRQLLQHQGDQLVSIQGAACKGSLQHAGQVCTSDAVHIVWRRSERHREVAAQHIKELWQACLQTRLGGRDLRGRRG